MTSRNVLQANASDNGGAHERRRAQDADDLARKRSAVEVLRALVRDERLALPALLALWISDATRRGFVRLEPGNVARAARPDAPETADETLRFSTRYTDPARVADEAEVDALNWAMKCGLLHGQALHALGCELVGVPLQLQLAAMRILGDASLLAHNPRGAPQAAIDRIGGVLEHSDRQLSKTEPWQAGLRATLSMVDRDASPRKQVVWVLDLLATYSASAPQPFRERRAPHVAAAVAFMRTMRLREKTAESQPRSTARGPKLSAWGAAAAFAKCFGVTMPRRESDAKRGKSK